LSQKERAFQVGRHDTIKAGRRRFQNIEPPFGRNTCVVDQYIDAAKLIDDRFDHFFVVFEDRDIALNRQESNAAFFDSLFDFKYADVRETSRASRDVVAGFRKLDRDAAANAPACAGDEGYSMLVVQTLGLREPLSMTILYLGKPRRHFRVLVIRIERITP
jgi:hypothetical protein